MSETTRLARPPRWLVLGWILFGAMATFTLLSMLTIGVFVLPFTIALGVALAVRSAMRGVGVALIGVALPLLWIAWLNRHGPGTYCVSDRYGTACTDEFNPWGWVVAAAGFALLGALAWRATNRAPRHTTSS